MRSNILIGALALLGAAACAPDSAEALALGKCRKKVTKRIKKGFPKIGIKIKKGRPKAKGGVKGLLSRVKSKVRGAHPNLRRAGKRLRRKAKAFGKRARGKAKALVPRSLKSGNSTRNSRYGPVLWKDLPLKQ